MLEPRHSTTQVNPEPYLPPSSSAPLFEHTAEQPATEDQTLRWIQRLHGWGLGPAFVVFDEFEPGFDAGKLLH